MSKVLLITNPAHDPLTCYLSAWSEELIEKFKGDENLRILELKERDVSRARVTDVIRKERPQLIIFNGHGDEKSIKGYELEILVQIDDNEEILKNKIVHVMSCRTGKELGPRCISIGGLAYIGYKENFKIAYLANRETNGDKRTDSYASFILGPAFTTILSLMEGKKTEEAYKLSQQASEENLRFLTTSKDDTLKTVIASRVYHNYINQVCLGNPAAHF